MFLINFIIAATMMIFCHLPKISRKRKKKSDEKKSDNVKGKDANLKQTTSTESVDDSSSTIGSAIDPAID